jgi:hypothetical protein
MSFYRKGIRNFNQLEIPCPFDPLSLCGKNLLLTNSTRQRPYQCEEKFRELPAGHFVKQNVNPLKWKR